MAFRTKGYRSCGLVLEASGGSGRVYLLAREGTNTHVHALQPELNHLISIEDEAPSMTDTPHNSDNIISSKIIWIDLENSMPTHELAQDDALADNAPPLSDVSILGNGSTDRSKMPPGNNRASNLNDDTMNSTPENNHPSKKRLTDFFSKTSGPKKWTHSPSSSHHEITNTAESKKLRQDGPIGQGRSATAAHEA
jgi:hypothetical protein